jgi:hypothetical protein
MMPTQSLIYYLLPVALPREIKRLGREAGDSTPSSVEIEKTRQIFGISKTENKLIAI